MFTGSSFHNLGAALKRNDGILIFDMMSKFHVSDLNEREGM